MHFSSVLGIRGPRVNPQNYALRRPDGHLTVCISISLLTPDTVLHNNNYSPFPKKERAYIPC
jgi:hypothetical protein